MGSIEMSELAEHVANIAGSYSDQVTPSQVAEAWANELGPWADAQHRQAFVNAVMSTPTSGGRTF